MPVSLKTPQQWACSQCDWRQAVVNKSDVLLPKLEKCPKCGSEIGLKATMMTNRITSIFKL
ncbi:hypothetical protein CYJ99_11035 [Neisseria perflava]|jgi:hypothetical protein|uniref:Uncharacterized protein n=1 Tax=Neisseria perflava TaxID=33053 RepID=A0A9X7I4M1_NEIPE|nr:MULTISPECIES: hypothetical protein [Neisseria]PLA48736.1 hypothetical protein CYJ99_11035 [Neisseria perflava]WOS97037.1 hypothetical protein CYJ98_005460 [Neisseria perflava]